MIYLYNISFLSSYLHFFSLFIENIANYQEKSKDNFPLLLKIFIIKISYLLIINFVIIRSFIIIILTLHTMPVKFLL